MGMSGRLVCPALALGNGRVEMAMVERDYCTSMVIEICGVW